MGAKPILDQHSGYAFLESKNIRINASMYLSLLGDSQTEKVGQRRDLQEAVTASIQSLYRAKWRYACNDALFCASRFCASLRDIHHYFTRQGTLQTISAAVLMSTPLGGNMYLTFGSRPSFAAHRHSVVALWAKSCTARPWAPGSF